LKHECTYHNIRKVALLSTLKYPMRHMMCLSLQTLSGRIEWENITSLVD